MTQNYKIKEGRRKQEQREMIQKTATIPHVTEQLSQYHVTM